MYSLFVLSRPVAGLLKMKFIQSVLLGNLRRRDSLGDLGVNEGTILKLNLKKWEDEEWIRLA